MPSEFDAHLVPPQWHWLRHKIKNLVEKDAAKFPKKNTWSDILAIAMAVARDLVARRLLGGACHDDAGGFLPRGFILHPHALFQLSLDRVDTTRPHFDDPSNVRSNVHFVALGINTRACIVSAFEGDVCRVLRNWVNPPGEETDYRHARTCGRSAFYRDEQCKRAFGESKALADHAETLLREQKGLCALSGIRLVGPNGPAWRRMSLDAVDPLLGHVPGNLRWICMFLQCVCNDKKRLYTSGSEEPTQWTPELYRTYVQSSNAT